MVRACIPSYLEQGSLLFLTTAQPYVPSCWPFKQKRFVKMNLIIHLLALHSDTLFKNHPQTSPHMFKTGISFFCQLPHLHMPACIAVTVLCRPNPKTELKQMKEQLKHVQAAQAHTSDSSSSTDGIHCFKYNFKDPYAFFSFWHIQDFFLYIARGTRQHSLSS